MKSIFIIAIIILFTGCSSGEPDLVEYPKWSTNITKDTGLSFYGIGEAASRKGAIVSALDDIASKMSTSVESSFSQSTEASSDGYSTSSRSDIRNSVKKIEFTNYKIEKEANLNNGNFLIMLSVDKIKLSNSLEDKIQSKIKNYQSKINNQYGNILSKIKEYKIVKDGAKALQSDIFILGNMSNSIDAKSYLTKTRKLVKTTQNFKDTISVNVSPKNSDYAKELSSMLSDKGFYDLKNRSRIKITIKETETEVKALGNIVLKAIIEIDTRDSKTNKKIFSKRLIVGGKSKSSISQAHEFSVVNFKKRIIKDKILYDLLNF